MSSLDECFSDRSLFYFFFNIFLFGGTQLKQSMVLTTHQRTKERPTYNDWNKSIMIYKTRKVPFSFLLFL